MKQRWGDVFMTAFHKNVPVFACLFTSQELLVVLYRTHFSYDVKYVSSRGEVRTGECRGQSHVARRLKEVMTRPHQSSI